MVKNTRLRATPIRPMQNTLMPANKLLSNRHTPALIRIPRDSLHVICDYYELSMTPDRQKQSQDTPWDIAANGSYHDHGSFNQMSTLQHYMCTVNYATGQLS